MSAVEKKLISEKEYLATERNASYKSEFFKGEAFAMAGASRAHNIITGNLVGILLNHLKGKGCRYRKEIYALSFHSITKRILGNFII
jgi:Uma2 family endonuclease